MRRLRSLAVLALKLAVTAGLIWYALRNVPLSDLWARLAAANGLWLGAGLLVLFVVPVMAAYRWRLVSGPAKAPLREGQALRFLVIGLFFNQTLPSTVGGDAVRIWLVRQIGARLSAAVASVAADRAFGLAALAWVALAGLPAFWAAAEAGALTIPAHWLVILLAAAEAACLAILVWLGGPAGGWLDRRSWASPVRLGAMAIRQVLRRPRPAAAVIVLSLVVHVFLVLAAVCAFAALGLPPATGYLFGAVPLVILLAVIPISLGGWGVRETAMVTALAPIGIAAADAVLVSVLIGLGQFLVGLPGGLLWLRRVKGGPGGTAAGP